jgi:aryl-alcohol dehydrogenase-like predicted oxidoreductase
MVQRRLGRTGLTVSVIGLGTTKFGRNTDVKYPAPFELPGSRDIEEILETALALGVNLIDTAPAYGTSEERLGRALKNSRERWVLCTKCGESYRNGRSTYDFTSAALIASVDESLRRLKTDYIDLLLLHSDGRDLDILQNSSGVEALLGLKAEGKVRAAGISAKTSAGIAAAVPLLDVVMAPFNAAEPALGAALAAAHDHGTGVIAIKTLSSGRLHPTASVQFIAARSFIDSMVVGTINPDHLREVVAAVEQAVEK